MKSLDPSLPANVLWGDSVHEVLLYLGPEINKRLLLGTAFFEEGLQYFLDVLKNPGLVLGRRSIKIPQLCRLETI